MPKEKVEHVDILGQPVSEGSYVAVSHKNGLYVCKITKLTEKMARVTPIKGYYRNSDGWLVYTSQCVILSGPDALAYILINEGK